MTLDDFIALAAEMRQAQRDYFAARTPSALNHAKKLERELDQQIKNYKNGKPEQQACLL